MGGSKDPVTGSAANGIWVHPHCHEKIERNRTQALEKGWLVSQYQDPEEVPFRRYTGWVLLRADGTLLYVVSPDTQGEG